MTRALCTPAPLEPISGNPAVNRARLAQKAGTAAATPSENVTQRQKALNGEISLPSHFGYHLREAGAGRSKAPRRRV